MANSEANLSCGCGHVTLRVTGPHIAVVECLCSSCRKAGAVLDALPVSRAVLDEKGATHYVMHRKDRVSVLSGREALREYRLSAESSTRRVVAACCNTPVLLEMKGGHWFSLYAGLWPEGDRPAPELRTMTGDLDDPGRLPDDIPNLRKHSLPFFARLLGAWAAMGFRSPKLAIDGELQAPGG